MELVAARGAVLEAILDETIKIWAEGLERPAYARYNEGQRRTAWGGRHLDRVALVDGSRILASTKRYRLTAMFDGRPLRLLGVGAVFTQPAERRRGAAAELLTRVYDEAARDGFDAGMLFSEIGPSYYERFGFRAIDREELTVSAVEKPGAPAVLVRTGEERDVPAVADILRGMAANARLALAIDDDWVRYGLAKKRLLAGLGRPGVRSVEFYVAEEGASAVAFVLITRSPRGLMLEACGDRDPAGARVGAMLQVLRARTPGETAEPVRAWLPPGFLPPQLTVVSRRPARELLMLKPLRPGLDLSSLTAAAIVYWHGDVF
jgi:hypothetical protein